jgi:hypothetical protein
MVPELNKQVEWGNNGNHIARYAQQGRWQEKKREQFEKNGDALPQGTRQVELFTAVVNDMGVPEYIGGVLNPVYPITREI